MLDTQQNKIKELKKYSRKLDAFRVNSFEREILAKGVQPLFVDIINCMNCTKQYDCGRPMQTINYLYNVYMTEAFMLIDMCNEHEQEMMIESLYDRHNKNIEFEKINGTIVYDKLETKKKSKSRKVSDETSPVEEMIERPKLTIQMKSLMFKLNL